MKLFDAHFHIIDPRYPLFENNGYLPPSFVIEDYREQTKEFNVIGGAIVSGSFQAFDQEYLIDSLSILGNNYFGVANIPTDIHIRDLSRLKEANIVAVRFNLKRGGSEGLNNLEHLSNRLFDQFGWHTELYVDSKDLRNLRNKLKAIPKFSIDHIGLSKEGLPELYYWVEQGTKIKATGFGRVDFDPIPVLRKIYNLNPDALMFGTDLPSTRANTPFSKADIFLIKEHFTEEEQGKIFFKNAYAWYSK